MIHDQRPFGATHFIWMDFWSLGLEELVCCRPKEDRRLRDSSGVARARNRRQDHHLRAIRRLYS